MIKGVVEAGCDEAGRGPLAGSVFAAAVILPPDFRCELLNDSKQLTEKQRYALRPLIEREAIAWAVVEVLAKTYRDDYMLRLHEEYPQYGWADNKGYPTKQHYEALRQFGPTPYHRKSFNLKLD